MRILLTADPELPVPPALYGGIERIIDVLVRGLKDRGHTIGLVANRSSDVSVDELFAWPGESSQGRTDIIRNTAALYSTVKQFKPDIVHSFSRVMYLLPLMRGRLPKVMSYQRLPAPKPVRYGAMLGSGTLSFTGCSEFISARIRNAGGKATTIYNCVELDKYKFEPSVPPDAPLVFLSRVERLKGAHTAIAVARRMNRRLLIAGNHGDAGEEGRYWQEEIKPQLGTGIDYVGPINDQQKNELLGQAAAMLVPIEWEEPFGIVFAEALACGTPIISCPRGALPEIVRPGVDGFLIRSVEEACLAVERLPSIDRRDCRQRAAECFSSIVVLDHYERLYRGLVHPNGAA
jgi:glycosyltransferase involved in cell wall biosynthesis